MEMLDIGLRGAAIALLVVLATLMSQARIGTEGRLSILAVCVTKTAFLLTGSAADLPFPPLVQSNLILLTSLTPNALTWLIVTIFIDPPGRRWHWLLASSVVSLAHYLQFSIPQMATICAILAIPLYGALLALAVWSAREDLVECRCQARPAFAAAIAGLALLTVTIQALGTPEAARLPIALATSAGTFAVTFAFAIWILRPELSLWPGPPEVVPMRAAPKPETGIDQALLSRLAEAMENGIWREEGLTIGALAARLSVPEHRLRRAINTGLGHRNFSSFINSARIDAARQMLGDPHGAGTTVLEIAYGVGFASLGPFNRAFRAETGMSPTEYRRHAGADRADIQNIGPISSNLH